MPGEKSKLDVFAKFKNIFMEEVVEEVEENNLEVNTVDYSKNKEKNLKPSIDLKILDKSKQKKLSTDNLVTFGAGINVIKSEKENKEVKDEKKEVTDQKTNIKKVKNYEPSAVISPFFGINDSTGKVLNPQIKKVTSYKTSKSSGVISPVYGMIEDKVRNEEENFEEKQLSVKQESFKEEKEILEEFKDIPVPNFEVVDDSFENTQEYINPITDSDVVRLEEDGVLNFESESEEMIDDKNEISEIFTEEDYDITNEESDFFEKMIDQYPSKVISTHDIPLFDDED